MKALLFPGQGAQFKGMGKDLFQAYPEYSEQASDILGYRIDELCIENPDRKLRLTQYTQPAVYTVNALRYFKLRDEAPAGFKVDFAAGHSLGEYNALLAAESFDFATGLRLVKKRGELMGAAGGGTMAAIIGTAEADVRRLLSEHRLDSVDLANFNTPSQLVVAGPTEAIFETERICGQNDIKCLLLNVTGPFHSRYMQEVQAAFAGFLAAFPLAEPKIPVIANSTARPYASGSVVGTLTSQITSPVLWSESIAYLMRQGEMEFLDMSTGFLGKMVEEIRSAIALIDA